MSLEVNQRIGVYKMRKDRAIAIMITCLLGMFNAKALPCDYKVTSAINEYTLEVLKLDVIVTCGHGYNLISDVAKCSYDFSELKVESDYVNDNLLTPSTITKIDKCLGVR